MDSLLSARDFNVIDRVLSSLKIMMENNHAILANENYAIIEHGILIHVVMVLIESA